MYLSSITIENFRVFGQGSDALVLPVRRGLTALVGENDSGKTAIIDALRYALGTTDQEWHCAWMLRKLIVPCILDDTPTEPVLLNRNRIDFRDFGKGYKELLAALDLAPKVESCRRRCESGDRRA